MLQLAPGVAGTSVNGVRTRGNNFQIDGADNNDAFQNAAAVNQGGVSGIAGTLLPIEAIDQFSVQSGGQAEMGRNAGSTVNLVIKSGHEQRPRQRVLLQPQRAPVGELAGGGARAAPKRQIRNNQYGFSLGGPIVHNKTFFFSTLEAQKLTAGNTLPTTAPSPAWVASATQLLNQFGVPVNPVSTNLLALWPADSRTGPAIAQNFIEHRSEHLHQLQRHRQSRSPVQLESTTFRRATSAAAAIRWRQTNSPYRAYFQAVPSRMHNVSLVDDGRLHVAPGEPAGGRLQLLHADVQLVRLLGRSARDGVEHRRRPIRRWPGRRTSRSAGSRAVGGTQPLGRVDKTIHFTDNLSYATGSHQLKVGGEARVAEAVHLLRQQQARHVHLRRHRRARGRRCRRRRPARR